MCYYQASNNYGRNKTNVELNLSNSATKSKVKKQEVLMHQILLKKLI